MLASPFRHLAEGWLGSSPTGARHRLDTTRGRARNQWIIECMVATLLAKRLVDATRLSAWFETPGTGR